MYFNLFQSVTLGLVLIHYLPSINAQLPSGNVPGNVMYGNQMTGNMISNQPMVPTSTGNVQSQAYMSNSNPTHIVKVSNKSFPTNEINAGIGDFVSFVIEDKTSIGIMGEDCKKPNDKEIIKKTTVLRFTQPTDLTFGIIDECSKSNLLRINVSTQNNQSSLQTPVLTEVNGNDSTESSENSNSDDNKSDESDNSDSNQESDDKNENSDEDEKNSALSLNRSLTVTSIIGFVAYIINLI